METASYEITRMYPGKKKILAMRRKKQSNLIWFIPFSLYYLLTRGWRWDIIHLSDFVLAPLGWVGKFVLRKTVVISIHGLDISYGNGTKVTQIIYRQILRLACKSHPYHFLIANSEPTKRLALSKGLDSIRVIPLGVTTPKVNQKFTRNELEARFQPASEATVFLCTIGRMVKRKGISWFVDEVFPYLSQHATYIVAGPYDNHSGRQEIRAINEIIGKNKLGTRVRVLGEVDIWTKSLLLNTCDIFVMPNIKVQGDIEGFGIVAGEAASGCRPVVAANVDGIPEIIHHGENGLLLTSQCPTEWRAVISKLIGDPDARDRMGKKAQAYTVKHFSWENVAYAYYHMMRDYQLGEKTP